MSDRQVGKIDRVIGVAGFLYLIILVVYVLLTGGKGPLVLPLFLIGIPTLIAAAHMVDAVRTLSLLRTIRAFESGLRIDKQRLILPDNLKIELGLVNISGELVVSEQVYRGRRHRKIVYKSEVAPLNPIEKTTNTINLEDLCNQPSLVYVSKDNRVIVEAPGFIVSSGRFKNIGVICLDSSSLPKRVIELSTGDHADTTRAVITSFGDYFEASLSGVPCTGG